ncbi:competence protein CoiA [Aetokthonos hydrillicola Thurmond2011]|jgi:hypothetical protein|uniref:Competence protein CoiA n=1 Tax=Aetokthonos hydrillicola Thurmond2011 TaxID=2712845 RepID=A0AAP5MD96_9CYAN|nr:competence protein CoiA family protein [Aetokthonos hydrillicola]MBO3463978.1 hypothetical protein [Aetokthonos hydrillicola CCALA 1050]MBW4589761.1 competence protein CoiA [Aetokthonos hydrillicola CCALA 1050]MDR9900257.1 competence protein CoiA [Aetokthonos hydrillicola Thurmond2011]
MSKWHLNWQEMFAFEYREVVMCNGLHKHRADLCLPQPDNKLLIVEFQHSSISVNEICRREQFYTEIGHLLWVFDAREFRIRLEPADENIYRFSWVRSRSSLWAINSSLAFDFGHVILLIAQAHQRSSKHLKSGGWGWLYRKEEFVNMLHKFTALFTFDTSKPLWERKKRNATTPQLKAAAKLVQEADSMIVEHVALLELKKQLPNVSHLGLRGALFAACQQAGYVKTHVNQQYLAWVKEI